ncbi:MAG: hypothetical protein QY302_10235 [Anaerolineales bacterium]|nr:MAG: hypothetical protein QY302_10235 [Anaerolineales bacterium]
MNDLEFLKELRDNVVKGKSDIARHEMALKMIDDWIDEKAAEHHAHADGACPHANTINPLGRVFCPDCQSLVTAPQVT